MEDRPPERRMRADMREIFEQACVRVFPVLEVSLSEEDSHVAPLVHIVLREYFPQLHRQDVPIMAAAIERVFRERQKLANNQATE